MLHSWHSSIFLGIYPLVGFSACWQIIVLSKAGLITVAALPDRDRSEHSSAKGMRLRVMVLRVQSQDLGPNSGSSAHKYGEVLWCSYLGQWDTAATGAPKGKSISNHSNSFIPKNWMHWGDSRQVHQLGSAFVKDV